MISQIYNSSTWLPVATGHWRWGGEGTWCYICLRGPSSNLKEAKRNKTLRGSMILYLPERSIIKFQRYYKKQNFAVNTVSADVLAPLGARTSADTVMTKLTAVHLTISMSPLIISHTDNLSISWWQPTSKHCLMIKLSKSIISQLLIISSIYSNIMATETIYRSRQSVKHTNRILFREFEVCSSMLYICQCFVERNIPFIQYIPRIMHTACTLLSLPSLIMTNITNIHQVYLKWHWSKHNNACPSISEATLEDMGKWIT